MLIIQWIYGALMASCFVGFEYRSPGISFPTVIDLPAYEVYSVWFPPHQDGIFIRLMKVVGPAEGP